LRRSFGKTEGDTEAWLLDEPHESGNVEGEEIQENGCSVLHWALRLAHQF
jgi:hypothetical protein